MPVNYVVFNALLLQAGYPDDKRRFLISSFKDGFDLGYRGPENVRIKSHNLHLEVGSQKELWNKVMAEVKERRYAGPYREVPFKYYIQSPIGLVPKDHGRKTRLIFHLSYPKGGTTSVNSNTPKELSTVSYPDFDDAVRLCLEAGPGCEIAKSDHTAAFRHLGIRKEQWKFLVMKAQNPRDQKIYYFVDKCMPFGASISCANFQKVSDAISYLVTFRTGKKNINYLDDYFFAALLKLLCNQQVRTFLDVCSAINFPVSMEKTFWATDCLSFLGLLINTRLQVVLIPIDKIDKALKLIDYILSKKRITLETLQQTCGTLNFLCKCIVPGRAFTRRLYAAGKGLTKPNHHLPVDTELRLDLTVWRKFLCQQTAYCRPFMDFARLLPQQTDFHTDASRNFHLGAGGHWKNRWFILQWNEEFMERFQPSIDYLELYALAVGVLLWVHNFTNQRIVVHCDNLGVVHMVNNNSSNCKNCMMLIRIIVLVCLKHNVRVFAQHLYSKQNKYADLLSRLKYQEFRKLSRLEKRKFAGKPEAIPDELWPMDKVWMQ